MRPTRGGQERPSRVSHERACMKIRIAFGWCCLVVVLVVASSVPGAQVQDPTRSYAPTAIAAGKTLYSAQCTTCHGPTGDSIGGVDLSSNQFRRAATDQDVMKLINAGIPDSGMPSHNFNETQLISLVAYLRNMRNANSTTGGDPVKLGDAARGKILFEGDGKCASCHRVKGQGSRKATDLSNVGVRRSADSLRNVLLDPTATMWPINRPVRAVTKDGKVINGRRLNEDPFTVQLADDNGRLVSLMKADLREYTIAKESPMPSYRGKLSEEELANLLSYLLSLKGS
jgi:putative heme-binding domain-containing protein